MATFIATDPAGYEQYVGRLSRRLARVFVEHVSIRKGARVLDVGCGTGNLAIALGEVAASVIGVDLSAPYVEFARAKAARDNVKFDVGDALNLPYTDGAFDHALSMLALDVLPDPARGLAEMGRVTRPGGTVAVVVNDFRCGWTPFSMLWDTAAVLDSAASAVRDEMVSKPLGWPDGLATLFRASGLADVQASHVGTLFEYASFDDYWDTFLTGQGKTGAYVSSLEQGPRRELERHVRAAYLCGMSDGPRAFTTSFWLARGSVPEATAGH